MREPWKFLASHAKVQRFLKKHLQASVWYEEGWLPTGGKWFMAHNHLQCFLTDAALPSPAHSRLPHVAIIGVMRGAQLEEGEAAGNGHWWWSRLPKHRRFLVTWQVCVPPETAGFLRHAVSFLENFMATSSLALVRRKREEMITLNSRQSNLYLYLY